MFSLGLPLEFWVLYVSPLNALLITDSRSGQSLALGRVWFQKLPLLIIKKTVWINSFANVEFKLKPKPNAGIGAATLPGSNGWQYYGNRRQICAIDQTDTSLVKLASVSLQRVVCQFYQKNKHLVYSFYLFVYTQSRQSFRNNSLVSKTKTEPERRFHTNSKKSISSFLQLAKMSFFNRQTKQTSNLFKKVKWKTPPYKHNYTRWRRSASEARKKKGAELWKIKENLL